MDPNQDNNTTPGVQPTEAPATPNNQPSQFMDIQKPKVTESPSEESVSIPVAVQSNDATEEQPAEIPVSESVAEQMDEHTEEPTEPEADPEIAIEPDSSAQPQQSDEQPEAPESVTKEPVEASVTNQEASTGINSEAAQPLLVANPKPKKTKKPVLIIIIAILIAGALIGAAVYAYMQTKDQATQTTTQQQPIEETVTPEEVDKTVDEVDQALTELDDSTDFSESDVSEETLGL